jgi:hypothetical protein
LDLNADNSSPRHVNGYYLLNPTAAELDLFYMSRYGSLLLDCHLLKGVLGK